MAYLDFQPQETPDRDWGRQHFIRLIFALRCFYFPNLMKDIDTYLK